jgi:hypothetical protein
MSSDYLKKTQALGRIRLGRDLTDEEIAGNFSIHGLEQRTLILQTIEEDDRAANAIGSDNASLREEGRRKNTISAMRAIHSRLRALGR